MKGKGKNNRGEDAWSLTKYHKDQSVLPPPSYKGGERKEKVKTKYYLHSEVHGCDFQNIDVSL